MLCRSSGKLSWRKKLGKTLRRSFREQIIHKLSANTNCKRHGNRRTFFLYTKCLMPIANNLRINCYDPIQTKLFRCFDQNCDVETFGPLGHQCVCFHEFWFSTQLRLYYFTMFAYCVNLSTVNIFLDGVADPTMQQL